MGIFVRGLYIGSEDIVRDRDGKKEYMTVVGVAVGVESCKVYLDAGEAVKLEGYGLGDEIELKVRPFASRNGIAYYNGKVM